MLSTMIEIVKIDRMCSTLTTIEQCVAFRLVQFDSSTESTLVSLKYMTQTRIFFSC